MPNVNVEEGQPENLICSSFSCGIAEMSQSPLPKSTKEEGRVGGSK
jgi:hypothetical protein